MQLGGGGGKSDSSGAIGPPVKLRVVNMESVPNNNIPLVPFVFGVHVTRMIIAAYFSCTSLTSQDISEMLHPYNTCIHTINSYSTNSSRI